MLATLHFIQVLRVRAQVTPGLTRASSSMHIVHRLARRTTPLTRTKHEQTGNLDVQRSASLVSRQSWNPALRQRQNTLWSSRNQPPSRSETGVRTPEGLGGDPTDLLVLELPPCPRKRTFVLHKTGYKQHVRLLLLQLPNTLSCCLTPPFYGTRVLRAYKAALQRTARSSSPEVVRTALTSPAFTSFSKRACTLALSAWVALA